MNKFWLVILIFILVFVGIQCISLFNQQAEPVVIIDNEINETELIDSLKDCLVFIENSGNGIVLTSDGVILTLSSIVNNNSAFIIKEKSLLYEVLKRDNSNDLALVQLGKQGLDINCQYSLEDIEQGDEVYILGINSNKQYIFNKGIIKNISDLIQTNIIEDKSMNGAVAFNSEGKIIGMVKMNNEIVNIIPSIILKEFTGL